MEILKFVVIFLMKIIIGIIGRSCKFEERMDVFCVVGGGEEEGVDYCGLFCKVEFI